MAKKEDDKKAAKGGAKGDAKPKGDSKPKAEAKPKGDAKKKPAKTSITTSGGQVEEFAPGYIPRMRIRYQKQAAPALMKQFAYDNPMMVPRLQKVVVNMGLGAAVGNPKIIDSAVEEVRAITGQQPVVRKARKSIASFKLRENLAIGVSVTLRKARMWEFVDRLVSLALPRVRDFKGVSPRGFDGRGNFDGPEGAVHLPRDRLRQDRCRQGDEHLVRHDGPHGRRRARPAQGAGHAVQDLTSGWR